MYSEFEPNSQLSQLKSTMLIKPKHRSCTREKVRITSNRLPHDFFSNNHETKDISEPIDFLGGR